MKLLPYTLIFHFPLNWLSTILDVSYILFIYKWVTYGPFPSII